MIETSKPSLDTDDIPDLLQKDPLRLLVKLYSIIKKDYGTISNLIYTDPKARRDFEDIAQEFLACLRGMYSAPSRRKEYVDKLHALKDRLIAEATDRNIIWLSLFKALGEYLSVDRRGYLRHSGSESIGKYLITLNPPNPIYKSLSHPIREMYGTGIRDITDFFEHFQIIETEEPRPILCLCRFPESDYTCTYMRKRLEEGDFRIAVTPFMKNIEFEFGSLKNDWPKEEKTPYWFEKVKNIQDAETQLRFLLEDCHDNEVDILILPELCIDDTLLSFIQAWLLEHNREKVSSGGKGILLVVAGSFHRNDEHGELCNMATVLNYRGDPLWTQKKLQRFSLDADEIKKNPSIKALLNISDHGGYEKIDVDEILYYADTPLGRISVCICIDYFHEGNLAVLRNSGINVFLIPSMTPQNSRFVDTARILGSSNLASTFFANSAYVAITDEGSEMIQEQSASFFYLPDTEQTFRFAVDKKEDMLVFQLPG